MKLDHLNWAQQKAIHNTADAVQAGVMRMYIDMPTGTGKTGVYLSLLEIMQNQNALPNTVIMAPTRLIADNILKEIEKFAPRVYRGGVAARLRASDLGDESARRIPVKVMTYNSGIEAMRTGLIKPELIVPDEGQHALSQLRKEVLASLSFRNTQIASTASPNYSREKSLQAAGYKEIYHLGLREAVEGNILSDIRNIMVELEESELTLDDIPMMGGDYDPVALERILMNTRALDAAIDFYRDGQNKDSGKPIFGTISLAFCNSIKHAQAYAKRFNRRFAGEFAPGVLGCAAIWGKMPDEEKNKLIEMHKDGRVLQLASRDYLVEGYDNPVIETVLNLRPTRSGVVAEQRGGRAIRYNYNDEHKTAIVADFVFPSKRNQQLLYGDVIGGYYFEKSSEHKTEKHARHDSEEEQEQVIDGLKVSYSQKEVFSFLRQREAERPQATRLEIAVQSKTIANAMKTKGLISAERVMKAVNEFLYNNKVEHDPRYKAAATEKKIMDVLKGTGAKDILRVKGAEGERANIASYTLTASIISGILQISPKRLFGALPENSISPIIDAQKDERLAPWSMKVIDGHGITQDHYYPAGDPLHIERRTQVTAREIHDAHERNLEHATFDLDATNPFEVTYRHELRRNVTKILQTLRTREEFIIRAIYGFNGPEEKLEEVGILQNNLTSQAIRVIQAKVERKLSSPWLKVRDNFEYIDHRANVKIGLKKMFLESVLDYRSFEVARKVVPKVFDYVAFEHMDKFTNNPDERHALWRVSKLRAEGSENIDLTEDLRDKLAFEVKRGAKMLGYIVPGIYEDGYKPLGSEFDLPVYDY